METMVNTIPLLSVEDALAVIKAGYVAWIDPADENGVREQLKNDRGSSFRLRPPGLSGPGA